jgi:hypothetical protein
MKWHEDAKYFIDFHEITGKKKKKVLIFDPNNSNSD